ncbi:hypothetical protein BC826DRAFT_566342 [Russula brevipes]|nr:hypothetical protein BC826DRAFT_566342 [Russula brevipes]
MRPGPGVVQHGHAECRYGSSRSTCMLCPGLPCAPRSIAGAGRPSGLSSRVARRSRRRALAGSRRLCSTLRMLARTSGSAHLYCSCTTRWSSPSLGVPTQIGLTSQCPPRRHLRSELISCEKDSSLFTRASRIPKVEAILRRSQRQKMPPCSYIFYHRSSALPNICLNFTSRIGRLTSSCTAAIRRGDDLPASQGMGHEMAPRLVIQTKMLEG